MQPQSVESTVSDTPRPLEIADITQRTDEAVSEFEERLRVLLAYPLAEPLRGAGIPSYAGVGLGKDGNTGSYYLKIFVTTAQEGFPALTDDAIRTIEQMNRLPTFRVVPLGPAPLEFG